jgi:alkylation response protein AidB-like acyl-CoA dehydrogenase
VLGQVGKGYKYAIDILNEGRIGIGKYLIILISYILACEFAIAKELTARYAGTM